MTARPLPVPPSPKSQVTGPIADQRSDGAVIDIATARFATADPGTVTAPGVGGCHVVDV